ncbi:M15 family metallopeptidase [Hyphomicrobium sp. 99]|uniref:M15 family metallopeptidase n=1 Tax=Hyphomicrobium sp. 99 TaxID=1163419 RepID=UPI0005F823F9|nr:M15 family metallopeptidase [Hyphomicrobium sp. 99]
MLRRTEIFLVALAAAGICQLASPAFADSIGSAELESRLRSAYPAFVSGVDGDKIVFRDGSRLPITDGKDKPFDAWLANPDIRDMFRFPYPQGAPAVAPARNFDPGRARNEAFFTKIYGDCAKPGFASSLTTITWLPSKSGQKIRISRLNGVAEHLQAVSHELDALPAKFDVFLVPAAGGYLCRTIAGTEQRSGHGYGIAIDIATRRSHYWRWAKEGSGHSYAFRNEIPPEIVSIFEKHGFIWGGRWYHYDTMHFEYRPELLAAPK